MKTVNGTGFNPNPSLVNSKHIVEEDPIRIYRCKNCRQDFEPRASTSQYCSNKCRMEYAKNKSRHSRLQKSDLPARIYKCKNCGQNFESNLNNPRFCSYGCKNKFYEIKESLQQTTIKVLDDNRGISKTKLDLINPEWRTREEWTDYPLFIRVYTCKKCGQDFTPSTATQKYCSKECYNEYYNEHAKQQGRFVIFERDDFRCVYCGKSSIEDGVKLHADHIYPESKGGETTADNLVTACQSCNLEKSDYELDRKIINRLQKLVNERNSNCGIHPKMIIKTLAYQI